MIDQNKIFIVIQKMRHNQIQGMGIIGNPEMNGNLYW